MVKYRLGDICEIVSGSTPKTGVSEYWDGDKKWITPAEITDESYIITDSVRKLTELGVTKTGLSSFPKGTVILSSRAPIGKVAIAGCEMYCNQGFKNLICSQKIYNRYLYWFLKGNTEYLNSLGRGATFKEISKQIVASIEINVPDMEQQMQAAENLERVSSIIRLRKQQLQKLDDLVKARFVEMFGDPEINSFDWPVCTLKELVSIEPQNGLYKPQSAYVQDGSGFPIVRIDAFYDGRITDFSALKRLECSESEVQRYLLQENDIVINRVNSIEYLGKCAHIKGLLEETVFESNMMRLHLDDTVMNAVFATKLLCSQYIYKQIMIRAKKAVNQASINQQDVLSFRMFVPPLELQEQFAAFVTQTDKSKLLCKKLCTKCSCCLTA